MLQLGMGTDIRCHYKSDETQNLMAFFWKSFTAVGKNPEIYSFKLQQIVINIFKCVDQICRQSRVTILLLADCYSLTDERILNLNFFSLNNVQSVTFSNL